MKNFNVNIIKRITAAAIPKKAARRLHKAKREYKDIKKLIYSAAKQGNSSICIDYLSLEPEIRQWLEGDGFKIEHVPPFSYKISWD